MLDLTGYSGVSTANEVSKRELNVQSVVSLADAQENHMLNIQIMESLIGSIGAMSSILTNSESPVTNPELNLATRRTIMKMHSVLGEILERLRTITIEE